MKNVRASLLSLSAVILSGLVAFGCGSSSSSGAGVAAPPPPPPTGGGGGGGGTGLGTTFSPSTGTNMVFVSNSTGDDTNPGTQTQPVKTIAAGKALLRADSPDWLLLKKGDVWDESLGQWRLNGASASAPMVIWAYGTGARPLLRTGSQPGIFTSGASNGPTSTSFLTISGIRFQAHTRIPGSPTFTGTNGSSGVNWLRGTTNLLIDDCVFEYYVNGLNIDDFSDLGQSGITLRRCLVLDSYAISPTHSQGIFANKVNGMVIEECIFERNGWNDVLSGGSQPTIFNHNVYIQSSCRNITIRKNIIVRASSHGLQLRPGGVCTDNIFIRNPINILLGGGTIPVPGGVDATCTGNVVVEGTDQDAANPRGWGIDLDNIKSATVTNNIIANLTTAAQNSGNTFAIDNDASATITNNTVFNWPGSAAFETPGPFVNDAVSASAYNALQGGPATLQGFIDNLRAQSRDSYNQAFTADALKTYFTQGFTPN